MTNPGRSEHSVPGPDDFWLESQNCNYIGPLSMTWTLQGASLRSRLEALAQFADIFNHPEFTRFPSIEANILGDATPVEEEMAWQADRFCQTIVDYGWFDIESYYNEDLRALAHLPFDEIIKSADVCILRLVITSNALKQQNYLEHWEECFEDGSLQLIVHRARDLLISLDQWYDRARRLGLRFRDYTAKEHQVFVPDRITHSTAITEQYLFDWRAQARRPNQRRRENLIRILCRRL